VQVFRKRWTRRGARAVRTEFEQHQTAGVFRIEPLESEVWEEALNLSRRYGARLGTRTLDLLHLAVALALNPDVFFGFEERPRKLANTERLRYFWTTRPISWLLGPFLPLYFRPASKCCLPSARTPLLGREPSGPRLASFNTTHSP
jgi:PIN domain